MSFFTTWDYLVLVSILVLFAIVGVYCRLTGGKQKTTREYLLANGSMPAWPVSFSLMCSIMSAITLLGLAQESYQFGMTFSFITLSYIISTPIAVYLFLPVFYNMQTMSVYEYLEKRFGYATRLVASAAFSVQMILYMGIVLYTPALALEAVTGIDKNTNILVLGLLCTFYSSLGGMKAVLITDVVQSLLMFAAVLCVIFSSAFKENGIAEIWNTAVENGRLNFVDISSDLTVRHSLWSLLCGGSVTFLSLYAINQMQVQRLMSVQSLKSAQLALWLNLPILIAMILTSLLTGLVIFHHYKNCDPVLEGRIHVRDQLMPLFIMDTMGAYPGLSGLIVSGIFSASLSTISSALSSLAAVTLEDYLKPFFEQVLRRNMQDMNTVLPSKIMTFLYGIICIMLAFFTGSMGGVLQASLTIFGIIGGPLLGLFTIGMFTTKANQNGSLIGIVAGLIFSFCIGFGKPKPPIPILPITAEGCPHYNMTSITTAINVTASVVTEYPYLYRISYLWLSVFGFLITAVVGYCLSVILEKLSLANNDTVYLDEGKTMIDFELFVPPLSMLLKRQLKLESKAEKV